MRWLAASLALCIASSGSAQSALPTACDSVIATAKVGEMQSGIFLSLQPLTSTIDATRARRIIANVGTAFVPPRPLKLSVFAGPSLVRGLRLLGADTSGALRAPIVNGIYRTTLTADDPVSKVEVVRRSLIDGFDSAVVAAIREASTVAGVFGVGSGNPLAFDLSFTSDSAPGAQRLFAATFPRLAVTDAQARTDSPAPKYPDDELHRSAQTTVVLRFVVSRDSVAEPGTVEVLRAASESFIRTALETLATQRFVPATVKGCAVAQQVDYSFAFLPPERAPQGLTRR